MNQPSTPNRRVLLKSALAGTVGFSALSSNVNAADFQQQEDETEIKTDKECVMEAGMTEAEADCWEKTAEAAGAFFNLPVLHPEDAKEVAVAIHVIQNKLLGRPVYRKYREIAEASYKLKQEKERKDDK